MTHRSKKGEGFEINQTKSNTDLPSLRPQPVRCIPVADRLGT